MILNIRPKTIKGMAALLKFESEVCWIQTPSLCIVSQMFNNCATGAQPEQVVIVTCSINAILN